MGKGLATKIAKIPRLRYGNAAAPLYLRLIKI